MAISEIEWGSFWLGVLACMGVSLVVTLLVLRLGVTKAPEQGEDV